MSNNIGSAIISAVSKSDKVIRTATKTAGDFINSDKAKEEVIKVIAESITGDLLDFLMTDGWFNIQKDASVSYTNPHSGASNIINWYVTKKSGGNPLKDYGYYGKFFETVLFDIPSNSFSGPDIVNHKIELKSSVINELERIWNNTKYKNFMTAGGTTNELTGEKSKAHQAYEALLKSGERNEEVIRKAYAEIGIEKLLYKMENFLFASVSTRGPGGGKRRRWGKTGAFAFTKLLYFYSIIEENVRKVLVKSVKVKIDSNGVVKSSSEFIAKKSSSYTIKIGFDYIEPWKTAEEWAENPYKFWNVRIDLFSSIEGAREFFRIVKNLKQ